MEQTDKYDNNDVPFIPKPKDLWRLARYTIYFITALSKIDPNNQHSRKVVSRSQSYVAVDVDESDPTSSVHDDVQATSSLTFPVDKNILISITKEKNLESLSENGGVKHLAFILGTNKNALGVSTTNTTEFQLRKNEYGCNDCQKPPKKGFLSFVGEALRDTTIIILLLCACLSLGFGMKQHGLKEGWYDGGSIFAATFLVVSISVIADLKRSRKFEKLSNISCDNQVEVLRDGCCVQPISIFEVVVGDIVSLKNGDQIPADGLFLDGCSLKVDESSMTGKSDHVKIDESNYPFLYSGTKVTDGYGRMLVTSVGMNTKRGEMMSSIIRTLDEETPLQKRLNKLTLNVFKVGLVIASLVFIILLIRYFKGHTKDKHGIREFNGRKIRTSHAMNAVIEMVSAAVTIIVVVVPASLPLVVTLTLAYSMKRMLKGDKTMVRRLSACETMGSVTTICSDNLGTLFHQTSVNEFWQGKKVVQRPYVLPDNVAELLQQAVGLNTTGNVRQIPSESIPEISGTPTEKAILKWAVSDMGMEIDLLSNRFEILKVEAFNSEKKRRGVMARMTSNSMVHLHWKGEAEMILTMCSNYYDQEGMLVSLEEEDKKCFGEIIKNMASQSLRCIAFAHKQGEEDGVAQQLDDSRLTLLGIVGIKYLCQPSVLEAIKSCRKAGVDVKKITGDNICTAKAIATECGILKPDEQPHEEAIIEGIQFINYSNEERMAKIDNIRVMARSSPSDKLLMVQCLKQKGHVVAMMGGGASDALALKEADIGISMGNQGADIAKGSSDIVILDDNFASVVNILCWGRWIYYNIQKFIQLQLTANVAALVVNFVTTVSSKHVHLTASQMLWLNLIINTLAALALVVEEPTDDLMEKHPIGKTEPLITKVMWRHVFVHAQMIALSTLQFKGMPIFGVGGKLD